jgi:hypothetical protein
MIGHRRERSRRFHARRGLYDLLPLIRPRQQIPKSLPKFNHLVTSLSYRRLRHNSLRQEKLLRRSRARNAGFCYISGDTLASPIAMQTAVTTSGEIFCICPPALPRCRLYRVSQRRKPIHRGRCASLPPFQPEGRRTCTPA